ncbi:hypothetical protein TNCV_171231 [Trichonephila clavipes]|nr:hypothetical protein TNCV_171231 [Trichonephila clavipes]
MAAERTAVMHVGFLKCSCEQRHLAPNEEVSDHGFLCNLNLCDLPPHKVCPNDPGIPCIYRSRPSTIHHHYSFGFKITGLSRWMRSKTRNGLGVERKSQFSAGQTDQLQACQWLSMSRNHLNQWSSNCVQQNRGVPGVILRGSTNHNKQKPRRYLSTTERMLRRRIRAHYEQLSEFERGRIIGLKEAG